MLVCPIFRNLVVNPPDYGGEPPPDPGAIAFVQTLASGTQSGPGTSVVATLTGVSGTLGNHIVVLVGLHDLAGAVSVTDTQGNPYSLAEERSAHGWRLLIFHGYQDAALVNGNTIVASGPNGYWGLHASEYSGVQNGQAAGATEADGTGAAVDAGTLGPNGTKAQLFVTALLGNYGQNYTPDAGWTDLGGGGAVASWSDGVDSGELWGLYQITDETGSVGTSYGDYVGANDWVGVFISLFAS